MSGMRALLPDLDRELLRDERGPAVARILERYSREHADWRRYALFDEASYARNLVRECERYELLVICWRAGQASPIHNHQGQRCWMAVLEGDVQETLFHFPAPGLEEGAPAPLQTFGTKSYGFGSVAFITDDIGLHEIRPAGAGGAVTLHLYARPIRECQIYDPASGRVTLRRLSYFSVDGERLAGAT